ncbi:MAG TPA: zf-HC2 domain-containing protein [Gemmatimonadales bacterium]|nr:zf-HC2 domain-containing protein [Gemmatimonadales bacterium]
MKHPEREVELNEYADGSITPEARRELERHLAECPACARDLERLRDLLRGASLLPRGIAPPRDRAGAIAAEIARRRVMRRRTAGVGLAAAAGVALFLTFGRNRAGAGWTVERVAGAPRIGSATLETGGRVAVGQWLETDDTSSALLDVGAIGQVDVRPGTRLQLVAARPDDHRLSLIRGTISAHVDAPPRIFSVETPAGTAVDLGCAYTLTVDSLGRGLIRVTGGYVEFDWLGRRSVVPMGAFALTRPRAGPGTPFVDDAPQPLRRALLAFDFGDGGAAAARAVLASARREDAITLWHLLPRVDGTLRRAVYERLARFDPPPAGVTEPGVLALDSAMSERWWKEIRRAEWRRVVLRGVQKK